MEFSISSVCWFFSPAGCFHLGAEGIGPPLPMAAIVPC